MVMMSVHISPLSTIAWVMESCYLCKKENTMWSKSGSYYIKALKGGSYDAFNALYDMHSIRLYGYCFRYTKSHEDTQDLVQDVFMKLWTYRDTIRDEDTILRFLFRIAKNQLLNQFRSQVSSPVFEEYIAYCNTLSLSESSTTEVVEFDDFRRLVAQIKSTLPDTQQKVYTYSKEEGLSNKEIAEKLGLSEQTVKNQLSLALKVFREKLRAYPVGGLFIAFFYI